MPIPAGAVIVVDPSSLIQFVDSISATAAVRLTLTTSPWKVLKEGTDIAPPPLRRAVASTLLADGARVPAAAFDNRVLRLHLQLAGTSTPDLMTAMQTLNRELDRPSNILRWQPENSVPAVYFRTFRSSDHAHLPDWGTKIHEFTVDLLAEPFAYGPKESLGAFTVANDPAAATNPLYFDLTGIKGDVETPLKLTIPNSGTALRNSCVAVRRRHVTGFPFLRQAESANAFGSDTTVQVNNAAWSGPGSNSVLVTFATVSARTSRFYYDSGLFQGAGVRGTYRAYAAIAQTVANATFTAALGFGGFPDLMNPVVTLRRSDTNRHLVDLGLVRFPSSPAPENDGPSGAPLNVISPSMLLHLGRETGSTGSLRVDYIVLVPADDRTLFVYWPVVSTAGSRLVIDGHNDSVYELDGTTAGTEHQPTVQQVVGGFPMISPAATNRVYFLRNVPTSTTDSAVPDTVTATTVITAEYWPRYRDVRPALT